MAPLTWQKLTFVNTLTHTHWKNQQQQQQQQKAQCCKKTNKITTKHNIFSCIFVCLFYVNMNIKDNKYLYQDKMKMGRECMP